MIYAESGQAGIDLYIEHKPKLVLLDMHLPGLDGLDITRRLMAIDPNVNIFLLTRYADEERTMQAIEAGARGFIAKSGGYVAAVVAIVIGLVKVLEKI